jgi:hypothetical protein
MDNEPEYWNGTHADTYPKEATYDDMMARISQVGPGGEGHPSHRSRQRPGTGRLERDVVFER